MSALSDAIANRKLQAGDLINETLIAQAFNVSRTPVKTALEMLCDLDIVHRHTGRGFIIGKPGETKKIVRLGQSSLSALAAYGATIRPPDSWISIYNQVEKEVCNRSVFGPLRIIEAELAKSFSVSRTVAHEVLTRLEAVGLVEKDPAGRWSIVAITPMRIRHLYEIRRYLEPPALRNSVRRIPASILDEMLARLGDAIERYPDVDENTLDQLERDLHLTCISYCDNPELIKLLEKTQALLISNKHMLGSYLRLPDMDPFLQEHLQIFDAIQQRKPALASKALDKHLQCSIEKMITRLQWLSSEQTKGLPPYLSA